MRRRFVLQVRTPGPPQGLMIVEAEASLVPDRGCAGRPGGPLPWQSGRREIGRLTLSGFFSATQIVSIAEFRGTSTRWIRCARAPLRLQFHPDTV